MIFKHVEILTFRIILWDCSIFNVYRWLILLIMEKGTVKIILLIEIEFFWKWWIFIIYFSLCVATETTRFNNHYTSGQSGSRGDQSDCVYYCSCSPWGNPRLLLLSRYLFLWCTIYVIKLLYLTLINTYHNVIKTFDD